MEFVVWLVCCCTSQLVRNLFFVVLPSDSGSVADCVGHGWSVLMDVHGYVVLILINGMVSNKTINRKNLLKRIFATFYVLSVANMHRLEHQQIQNTMIPHSEIKDHFRVAFLEWRICFLKRGMYSVCHPFV